MSQKHILPFVMEHPFFTRRKRRFIPIKQLQLSDTDKIVHVNFDVLQFISRKYGHKIFESDNLYLVLQMPNVVWFTPKNPERELEDYSW